MENIANSSRDRTYELPNPEKRGRQEASPNAPCYDQSKRRREESKELYELAIALYRGSDRVVQDFVKARQLFQKVAQESHTEAIYYLGRMLLKGEGGDQLQERGVALLESIKKKDIDALNLLAATYLEGKYGIKKDTLKALQYLKEASIEGSDWALENLVVFSVQKIGEKIPCTATMFSRFFGTIKNARDGLMRTPPGSYFEQARERGLVREAVLIRNSILRLLEVD